MSEREQAIQLLDAVPEVKIDCVVAFLQGIIAGAGEEKPNAETVFAMKELEEGGGECFNTLGELWESLEG